MAYSFQIFSANTVLTAAQMNQVEVNIRDHEHGMDGVSSVVVSRSTTINDHKNSTAEGILVSHALPANLLGTNRSLEMWFFGDCLNNFSASETLTLRIRYGVSLGTIIVQTAPSIGQNASRRQIFIRLVLMAAGATNSQGAFGWIHLFSTVGTNPNESIEGAGARTVGMHAALARDDTLSTNVLEVTAQFANASVNLSARHLNSRVWVLR